MKRLARIVLKVVGGLLALALLVFFAGVLWPLSAPAPGQRPERLLVTDVTIVDVATGQLRPGQEILIERGVITAVGPALAPAGAAVLAGGGRYAIPGLFDMHVHSYKLAPVLTHPLFVAAGVTAVRDMGGCIGLADAWVACAEDKRAWNEAVGAGRLVGPRFDQVTSLAMNGGSEIPAPLAAALGGATPAGARARVEQAVARGIDFLKPYNDIPRDSYIALAEAVRRQPLYLAGHLPLAVTGLEAVAAGQRSIEHALLFIWECYPGMAALRSSGEAWRLYDNALRREMIEAHDPVRCGELREAMIAGGTAYVPTHTTRKLDAYATAAEYRGDPRLRYVPGPLRLLWLEDADRMAALGGEGGADSYRAIYEFGLAQTGLAHEAGVTVLAGTDAPDSFAFPGSGLHDELEHLVAAGLSPLAALRAATLAPAEFLGLAGVAGVIAPGARADLVLLDGNPLADIGAVRGIGAVVAAGVAYERDDLDRLLAGVEEAAGSWSLWPKFLWQLARSPVMQRQFAD
jgi:hypothetical protein